jgi:hypothetical protein
MVFKRCILQEKKGSDAYAFVLRFRVLLVVVPTVGTRSRVITRLIGQGPGLGPAWPRSTELAPGRIIDIPNPKMFRDNFEHTSSISRPRQGQNLDLKSVNNSGAGYQPLCVRQSTPIRRNGSHRCMLHLNKTTALLLAQSAQQVAALRNRIMA